LTIGVQIGFIAGTFLYAGFNLGDLFSSRLVFCASALMGSAANAAFAWLAHGLPAAVAFRFLTGLTLAGIYPVGMKIVATWFRTGLGWRLGVMVGALVMGTASPYLIQSVGAGSSWRLLASVASVAAVVGGGLMLFAVGDGPYRSERARFDPRMAVRLFADRPFRQNALGYFGHMWELYALWSLIVFYLADRFADRPEWTRAIPLLAFATVATGAAGCVAGGWASRSLGERRVALFSLLVSGTMCVASGFAWAMPPVFLVPFLVVWGFFVVSDSPQFSALATRHCPPEYVATALTVQNGIGFLVTVLSLQLLPYVAAWVGWRWAFVFLAPGPALGAYFMWRLGVCDGRGADRGTAVPPPYVGRTGGGVDD